MLCGDGGNAVFWRAVAITTDPNQTVIPGEPFARPGTQTLVRNKVCVPAARRDRGLAGMTTSQTPLPRFGHDDNWGACVAKFALETSCSLGSCQTQGQL